MKLDIIIIRINPETRKIARMKARFGRDATANVRRILGGQPSAQLGWRHILDIEDKRRTSTVPDMKRAGHTITIDAGPTPLIMAGLLDASEDLPTWRLRGTEDQAGIGILFGRGVGEGMVDVPVSVEWVEKRIVWGSEASESDPA